MSRKKQKHCFIKKWNDTCNVTIHTHRKR